MTTATTIAVTSTDQSLSLSLSSVVFVVVTTGTGETLAFVIITLAIYGIWVDYRISLQISEFEERNGLGPVQDTSVIAVILDVASYFTAFFTNFVTSAIQQDQLNRLADKIDERLLTEAGVLA